MLIEQLQLIRIVKHLWGEKTQEKNRWKKKLHLNIKMASEEQIRTTNENFTSKKKREGKEKTKNKWEFYFKKKERKKTEDSREVN